MDVEVCLLSDTNHKQLISVRQGPGRCHMCYIVPSGPVYVTLRIGRRTVGL